MMPPPIAVVASHHLASVVRGVLVIVVPLFATSIAYFAIPPAALVALPVQILEGCDLEFLEAVGMEGPPTGARTLQKYPC